MKSYQQFFAEMKRRKVFRVAAIYGATAFVLLQLADLLVEALKLPGDFLTMITVLVLLGFPVALILAWAFETTPTGVRRTETASKQELAEIVAQPASDRWPAGLLALAGVAALVLGAWWVGRQSAPTGVVSDDESRTEGRGAQLAYADLAEDVRPSLAVLPFADMSPQGDQGYFSDGMTEEILGTLARIPELRIAGRTSTFAYKDQNADLRDVARELGVRYVVDGSVRKDGNQLRITAQLIDATDGSHLWSENYDRTLEGVFAIQTEIAEAIAEELRVPLGLEDPSDLVRPVSDFEAYDLYLAGRAAIRDRGVRLVEAVDLLNAAIGLDSAWAPAWAALAEAKELTAWYPQAMPEGVEPAEYIPPLMDEAEAAARRALDLEPRNASAYVALGSIYRNRAQWAAAEESYLEAIAIDPDNAEAHQQYGEYLLNVGRIAEAVRILDRAAVLDPGEIRLGMLAYGLRADGRIDEAAEVYERSLEGPMAPDRRRPRYLQLAHRYLQMERWEDAVEAMERANQAEPDAEPFIGSRREIEAFVDALRSGDASRIPDGASDQLSSHHWMFVGEPERAATDLLDYLNTVPYGRSVELHFPYYAALRSDPRVIDYLEERGLADVEPRRTPPAERRRPAALGPAGPPAHPASSQ